MRVGGGPPAELRAPSAGDMVPAMNALRSLSAITLCLCMAAGCGDDKGSKNDATDADAGTDAAASIDSGADGSTGTKDDASGPMLAEDDLSQESACCVGIAEFPNRRASITFVGLDTGKVQIGPVVGSADFETSATSTGTLMSHLFTCEGDDELVVQRVTMADGTVEASTNECVATTTDGTDVLVLKFGGGQNLERYNSWADVKVGTVAQSYSVGTDARRIAHDNGVFLSSTTLAGPDVRRIPLSGDAPETKVTLKGLASPVLGLDSTGEGRIVITTTAGDGPILLFDSTDGTALGKVMPANKASFQGIECGSGPKYCPASAME